MDYKDEFKKRNNISVSTARSQLIKKILFDLLVQTGKDICFRCQKKLTLEDHSIEHITPWAREPNSLDLFMDLTNISFSHLSCNSGAARKTKTRKGRGRVNGENVQCTKCLTFKSRTEFHKNKTAPTGCESLCKPCRKQSR